MVAQALQASADNAKAEGRPSSLRTIICGRNRLEDGSSKALARAFSSHGTLEVVRMPQNGIRPDGIRTIVEGLRDCKNLRHLDLQDNTFTVKGSKALAKALSSWPQLEILNVSDCLLSKKGGAAVFTALDRGENKQLKELLLQYNEIQADGVHILAQAIKSHLNLLEKLELNGNKFEEDDEVVEVLKEALATWDHEDALDELDEMEDIDSDDEDEEDEDSEPELVKEAEQAEAEEPKIKVSETEDEDLAEKLAKTHI
jgi:Ran GTPase-activating protein 1